MSHQYGPEPFPGPYLIQLFGLLDFRSEPVQSRQVALKSCSARKASARPDRRCRCLFLEEDRKRARAVKVTRLTVRPEGAEPGA
jgi:hypothetical protein